MYTNVHLLCAVPQARKLHKHDDGIEKLDMFNTTFRPIVAEVSCDSPHPTLSLRERAGRAQHARCAQLRNAQRFWGPLPATFLLRAALIRATRVLRAAPKM